MALVSRLVPIKSCELPESRAQLLVKVVVEPMLTLAGVDGIPLELILFWVLMADWVMAKIAPPKPFASPKALAWLVVNLDLLTIVTVPVRIKMAPPRPAPSCPLAPNPFFPCNPQL